MDNSLGTDTTDAGTSSDVESRLPLDSADIDDVAFPLPDDPIEAIDFLHNFINVDFRKIVFNMSRGSSLSDEDRKRTLHLIRAFNDLELYPGLAKKLLLWGTLNVIRGSNSRVTFPDTIRTMAMDLYNSFEEQIWGEDVVLGSNNDQGQNKAQRSSSSKSANQSQAATSSGLLRRPSPNHPIFGTNGMMRGILIKQGAIRVYQLDPTFPRRNANVFGANGLTVRDWWPMQRCALRDGAHGAVMAGISGKGDEGAYSVVVSGQYKDLDTDNGDWLWYSASDSHSNTNPDQASVSAGAKVLQRSITTQRPVRVLRSSRGESAYAPSAGIRYDGLYLVTAEDTNVNARKGLYIRFRLQRLPDQPPITRTHPTVAERNQCEQIEQGY